MRWRVRGLLLLLSWDMVDGTGNMRWITVSLFCNCKEINPSCVCMYVGVSCGELV